MSHSQQFDCKGVARPLFRGPYGATAPYFMHAMWMLPQLTFPFFRDPVPQRLQLEHTSKPSSSPARASVIPRDVQPTVTQNQEALSVERRSPPPQADPPPRTPNISSSPARPCVVSRDASPTVTRRNQGTLSLERRSPPSHADQPPHTPNASSSPARTCVVLRDVSPTVTRRNQGALSLERRSPPPQADQPPRTPNFSSIPERQPSSRLSHAWTYPSPSSLSPSSNLDRPAKTATISLTQTHHTSIALKTFTFDPFCEEASLEVDHGYRSSGLAERTKSGLSFALERNATSAIFTQVQATSLEDYLMTVITKSSDDAPGNADPPHDGTTRRHSDAAPHDGATRKHSQNQARTLIAPTPLRSRSTARFLESSPTPRLPAGFLEDLSADTVENLFARALPVLSRPDPDNMNILTAGTFKKVEECDSRECLVTFWGYVFGFWNGGELILSGCGTSSSALEWTEFISTDLIARLRCRLEEIAITSLDFCLVTSSLEPLLGFIADLQDLTGPIASRARQTLFVFLERQFASPDINIGLSTQLIGYIFEYYQEKSLDNPKIAESILEDLYKRLRSLIECHLQTTHAELDYSESQTPIISLAYFLKYLRVETLIDVRRLMPNKLLTRLLSFPSPDHHCGMDAVFEYSRSKACAILIILACSDLRRSGCVGCSRMSDDRRRVRNTNSKASPSCICALNVPILNDEFRRVRSYVRQGDLSRGLEALLHLQAVDYCTRLWEHMAARQLHTG